MYKVLILGIAKNDIKEAAIWYDSQKKGLGKKFTTEIRKQLQMVRINPYVHAVKYDSINTIILKKFPFMIHYSIDESIRTILISAVLHTSRNPAIWTERNE